MEDIYFRIIVIPVEKYRTEDEIKRRLTNYIQELTFKLESCGLQRVSLSFLKVKKSEEEDYPEIEELVLQVQAKCYLGKQSMHQYCNSLCIEWKSIFHPNASPIIAFYENKCFKNTRFSANCNVRYRDIAFGVLPHNGLFYQYASLTSEGYIDFFHDSRYAIIKYKNWELNFSYNNIKNIFVNINTNAHEIFFDLCNPPLVQYVEDKRNKFIGSYQIKHRCVTICSSSSVNNFYPSSYLLDIDILGRANVLKLSCTDSNVVNELLGRIHFRCSEKPVHYATIISQIKDKPYIPHVDWKHFGSTYLMTAIFKRNFTVFAQSENIQKSLNELETLSENNENCLEKALTLALSALETGKIINYWHAIERQYYYYVNNKDEIDYMHYVVPQKCCQIRRITITPTRQLLYPPEIMFGNRILRNFDSEYAVRVSFRDDNNSRLSFIAPYSFDNIFDFCIRNPMSTGISIGSRTFEFLAWSNSQIRDHGIWMYARDLGGKTAATIRDWMGDFSHIHSVPKYMARMGQSFSQTEDAVQVPLNPQYIRTERDIEGGIDYANGGKPYCFSDGVGRISSKLATQVRASLGHDKLCSAFQIRYGGYKGMLVVDPTLKDADIIFRNSMKKFDSPQNQRLEIAKTSAPISLQLNRPFITILNDLGVRHRTFLKLQEDMLNNLTDMLFEEEQAVQYLRSKTPSDVFKYKDLSKSGIYLTTEPFFRSLLLALHRHHVENIKTRANIAIDPSKGRNMLGVLDETGLLFSGQVFVQFTKDISQGETTGDTKILKGTVLVTKNPCMLPGDVRKFTAVDIPQLRHIVDCIVFPKRGSRPHPNEMAGSDLDGDEYAVLWDEDLIFHAENKQAGHFPSASIPDKDCINVTDMIECLINYIKNDQVGTIANAHLAHADRQGISSGICLTIAGKYSYAVDFAKTGVSKHLERDERPDFFPDFMEKNYKETYKSKKALGKMFRVAVDYESENKEASITYSDIQVDKDLMYPGWEKYFEDAKRSRNKYNTLLKTVLRNYGIQHEAEVFSGAFTNLHCRFQERKDKAEIEKVVIRCMKRLTKSMKEEFLEEFKECADIKKIDVGMLQKASAWYLVTYQDSEAKILSFPWTVSEYLANIKIRRVPNINVSPFSPIVLKMDEQIKVCIEKKQLPYFHQTSDWNDYNFLCDDPTIVTRALQVLIMWAQEEDIVAKPGENYGGLLYLSVFIKLFLYIAELSNYIVKKGGNVDLPKKKAYSSASLCIEFWRFCLRLRFYNKHEISSIIPFQVYKYSNLAKRAVVTFHRFAVLGKFQNLYMNTEIDKEIINMKPLNIESKIFLSSPIPESTLKTAEQALLKYSKVEYITLREVRQTKKVLVSASGTEQSIKTLKTILNKKHVILKELFKTGIMPEN